MAEWTDTDLLVAAREGDRAALESLLSRHQNRIYRFGMKMCRDPEDAKDVLQETLLAAARTVRDFRGASSLSTWLYTIARSFCIKQRRRSKFAPEPGKETSLQGDGGAEREAARIADPGRGPDEELAGREVEQALERAIAALEPMYREVLVLRDVEGLTAPEVAEVLGLGVEAVKSRLHRARLAVRAQVAPLLGVPADEPTATGCPDVLGQLSRRLEGEISSDLCADLERHLGECPRCRGACDSLRKTLALCSAVPAHGADVPKAIQVSVKRAIHDFLSTAR